MVFLLSPGNDHDATHAIEVLRKTQIEGSNASHPWAVDWWLYKERHLAECFFQKIKWFRRVATRYDKLDSTFLAFVYLAAIVICLL